MRRRVFVGVFSFGSNLCYTGPYSSSLALLVFFGVLRCLGCLEGACPVAMSLFLLFCLLFAPSHIMSFVSHIVCWVSVGRLLLLRDRELVSSCNIVLTCYGVSLVYRGQGVSC
jgi:hypothetical protein